MMDELDTDIRKLFNDALKKENVYTVATTVNTGFERQAVDECKEKFSRAIRIIKERGKIYFNVYWDQFPKVKEMRSVDNVYIVANLCTFTFSGTNKEADLQLLKNAVHNEMKLQKFLNGWKQMTGFLGKINPTIEEYKEAEEEHKASKNTTVTVAQGSRKRGVDPATATENNILKYRVTCERSGTHSFESADVARVIGGELQDMYHWLVDLSAYHLEIFCKLVGNEMVTHLRVTHESKHRRNISHFGPTTLRATICYNLVRLAQPRLGEIVIDPMCGGGSIPIEATLTCAGCYVLCGDNHPKALSRAKSNMAASTAGCNIDLVEWNVTKLPFNDASIDVIITDMPFGKRSGNVVDNRVLYKEFLLELARIVKPVTSRLVLLTYDKRSLHRAVYDAGNLFVIARMVGINMGGLQATVYVLKRTDVKQDECKPGTSMQYKRFKRRIFFC